MTQQTIMHAPRIVDLGDGLTLDMDAAYHVLVQGSSRAGKTNTMRVIIETAAFLGYHIIIVDPEGEYASLREVIPELIIIGGLDADITLTPENAAELTRRIYKLRSPVVFDVSEHEPEVDQPAIVAEIHRAINKAPKTEWHDLLLVDDELQRFSQKDKSIETKDMRKARREIALTASAGLKRGHHLIAGTQRVASLDNSVVGLCNAKLIGRSDADTDIKRTVDQIGLRGPAREDAIAKLDSLRHGQFYARGIAFNHDGVRLVQIKHAKTENPGRGASRRSVPPPRGDVLSLLAEPDTTSSEDVVAPTTDREPPESVRVLVARAEAAEREAAGSAREIKALRALVAERELTLSQIAALAANARPASEGPPIPPSQLEDELGSSPAPHTPAKKVGLSPTAKLRSEKRAARHTVEDDIGEVAAQFGLRRGARRMLASLASFHPEPLNRDQLSFVSTVRRSGTFDAYLADLRKADLVTEQNDGLRLSPAALASLNLKRSPKKSFDELIALWREDLRAGARRMLDVLLMADRPMTRDDLARLSSVDRSGTFDAYLGDLRRTKLVRADRDVVGLNDAMLVGRKRTRRSA